MSVINVSHGDQPLYSRPEFMEHLGSYPEIPDDRDIERIQRLVDEWIDDYDLLSDGVNGSRYASYASYDKSRLERKIYPLAAHLGVKYKHIISEHELERSLEFIDFAFDLYYGRNAEVMDQLIPKNVSCRVILPSESRHSDAPRLEGSLIGALPILQYVPISLRSQFALGLPPSVVAGNKTADGEASVDVLCPVFDDMMQDISDGESLELTQRIVADTVEFCKTRLRAASPTILE